MAEVRERGQEVENKFPEILTTNWPKRHESSQLESEPTFKKEAIYSSLRLYSQLGFMQKRLRYLTF